MLLLIAALLMGIAAGLIAAQKGRSGFGFGVLGFLLGPIGIACAALSSRAGYVKPPLSPFARHILIVIILAFSAIVAMMVFALIYG
jgi:hypothetical protein